MINGAFFTNLGSRCICSFSLNFNEFDTEGRPGIDMLFVHEIKYVDWAEFALVLHERLVGIIFRAVNSQLYLRLVKDAARVCLDIWNLRWLFVFIIFARILNVKIFWNFSWHQVDGWFTFLTFNCGVTLRCLKLVIVWCIYCTNIRFVIDSVEQIWLGRHERSEHFWWECLRWVRAKTFTLVSYR